MTTRNPFIDPIEAPDLATKIVAKDGSDDAGYVTVEDVSGLALTVPITATGSTEARSLADRFGDQLSVKDFGAVGDGVTNDRTAIAAAVAAARGGKLYFPEGQYVINTDGGSILLEEVYLVGTNVHDESEDVVVDQGSVLRITGTTNSPFLVRRGVTIEGMGFFYPDQTDSATPTAYPPTLECDYNNGPVNFVYIRDNIVWNAYRFLRIGNPNTGFLWIENNSIQGIHRAIEIVGNFEVTKIRGNSFSCGIWLDATEAGTRGYMRANAIAVQYDEGDGIIFTDNQLFGLYRGLSITVDQTILTTIANNAFDQILNCIYVEGPGFFLHSVITGNIFLPFNNEDYTQIGTAIHLNGTASHDSFEIVGNHFGNCTGSHIIVTGTAAGRLSITGNHFLGWAYQQTTPYGALVLNCANKRIQFIGNYLLGNADVYTYGIISHTVDGLHLGNNVFVSCTFPYSVTSAGTITATGNASVGTVGPVSENIVAITNDHWQTGNLWDKASGHSTKPAFLVRKNAAQTISTGALTDIAFGTETFDRGGDFATPTFTAPRAGRYRFSWALLHDDTGTDGDRWGIALSASSGPFLNMMYTMVSDYNSVSGGGILDLATGETVTLKIIRFIGLEVSQPTMTRTTITFAASTLNETRALRGTSIRGHGQLPQPVFDVQYIPPPVGGLNKRDAIPLMDQQDAIVLDNWIPDTNNVRLRGGYELHALITAGTAGPIETLIPYQPENTSNGELFAATGSNLVNVTGETTASATAVALFGLSNARWQYDHITNAAGSFLVICNGEDAPRRYDGSSWVTATITASGTTLPATSLVAVRNHMNRLWYVEENSLIPWYGNVNEVSGVLTQFIVPFRKGGKLQNIASWSLDGGDGSEDQIVFISSRGECVLYAGTDPGSVNTWGLVGRYDIPDVIGRRCIVNAGSDLGLLTVQGLVPLSQVIRGAVGSASRVAFTDKVSGYFREQFPASGHLFGWECIEYPRGNLVIINVPLIEGRSQNQIVCNVNVGSWCRFKNINVNTWTVFNDDIFCGGNAGQVYRYDPSLRTDGEAEDGIMGAMQTSYTTFGSPRTKRFVDARPLFLTVPGHQPMVTLQTDYDTAIPTVVIAAIPQQATQWDAGLWDTFQWAGGVSPVVNWGGAVGVGRSVSVAFAVSSVEEMIYNGADIGFETGNYL